MSFVYNQAFFKIFKTFDPVVIRNCQFYMNILPFDLLLDLRRLHFLDNVNNAICYDYSDGQLVSIMQKYGFIKQLNGSNNWKHRMWMFFYYTN